MKVGSPTGQGRRIRKTNYFLNKAYQHNVHTLPVQIIVILKKRVLLLQQQTAQLQQASCTNKKPKPQKLQKKLYHL